MTDNKENLVIFDDHRKMVKYIEDAIDEKLEFRPSFSTYMDEDYEVEGIPDMDSPFKHQGEVFFRDPYTWTEGGSEFTVGPVTNPTWSEALKATNEVMARVGDGHHVFLEGWSVDEKDPSVINISTGS